MNDSNRVLVRDNPEMPARPSKAPAAKAAGVAGSAPTRPKRRLTPFLREWHRRFGLFAFLFMGWLGVSGILINQSPSWGYDTDQIYWDWVMWLYSLEPEPPVDGFAAQTHWLAVTPEGTVLDAMLLTPPIERPLGMVAGGTESEPLMFIANAQHVAVVKLDGARYDELRSPILPVSRVRRIGSIQGVPGSVAVQDLDAFQTTDGGNNWTAVDPAKVNWSVAEDLPREQQQALTEFARPHVTLEHFLVDAHSGAIFGRAGVYLINAVGLAALWLSISGVWMWWRTRRR